MANQSYLSFVSRSDFIDCLSAKFFYYGLRLESGCVRLTNLKKIWLDGSRASFLVPGYSPSKS